jgi:Mn-containing catalase
MRLLPTQGCHGRLANVTDDPGIKDALGFLMTREIAHQKSFEKALHSIQLNFPQGKLPGVPEFTNVYYNMSTGDDSPRGPWNEGPGWELSRSRSLQWTAVTALQPFRFHRTTSKC